MSPDIEQSFKGPLVTKQLSVSCYVDVLIHVLVEWRHLVLTDYVRHGELEFPGGDAGAG